jgi:hypothetical protein
MKNLMLVLVGLFSITQVSAEPVYRPYATCTSPNRLTNIEIKQNTDTKDTAHAFSISLNRQVRGQQINLTDRNALRVPVLRKDVLEMFQSFENNPAYAFELIITQISPATMMGQFKGYYFDLLGRSVVYCSHHVTFGN